jgi:hypothetical protein
VIRTYRPNDLLRHVQPPPRAVTEEANFMTVGPVEASFPDPNDLPPGLRVLLEDEFPESPIVAEKQDRFSSRLGGWPAWLQESGVYSYGEFALQLDRFDVQTLRGGDSAVHYFFGDSGEWTWVSESLSPLVTPSGPH